MFWATVIDGTRLVSWNTMAMPSAKASDGTESSIGLPSNSISPEVSLMHAGEHLGQRRFAGAILADDSMDFAGLGA